VARAKAAAVAKQLVKSLDAVLAYQNDEVVYRFVEDFKVSPSEAEEIFTETKRWLWLCAFQVQEHAAGRAGFVEVPLFSEAFAVDMMWHTFLLFTSDYSDFCQKYFGFFIHHIPQTRAEKLSWQEQLKENAELAIARRKEKLQTAYELIYDTLGEDVLLRWCEEFPAKFASLNKS
jgi:hypothetical protein